MECGKKKESGHEDGRGQGDEVSICGREAPCRKKKVISVVLVSSKIKFSGRERDQN